MDAPAPVQHRTRRDTQMGRWKRVIASTRKARNGSRQIREVQLGHTGLNPMTARGRSAFACISRP